MKFGETKVGNEKEEEGRGWGRAEEKQNGVVVSRLSPISQATGSGAHKILILNIEAANN